MRRGEMTVTPVASLSFANEPGRCHGRRGLIAIRYFHLRAECDIGSIVGSRQEYGRLLTMRATVDFKL